MKLKKNIAIFLILLFIFTSYKYYQYNKNINSLKNFYQGGLGVVSDINSFFFNKHKKTGSLPSKQEVESFLTSLNSDFLKKPNQYFLNLNKSQ